jgi:puromycin-sensitive aminopeptidase
MENFGLIIFNETNMLLDRLNSSTETTITNAYIVAHEIAHQWFGNLVTMKWWNDLWLNEGFATWAGFLCINPFLKDYNIWTAFVCLRTSEALNLDCLNSTHSIAADVESPALIDEMFDDITYSKGACVIRMLNSYIGEDEFRSGIQDYLNSFKYANATTQDLCTHLSKYSKMPVDEFMHKWITKIGFPVVQVSRVIDKNGNTVVLLKQTRFLASGEHADGDTWPIPIIVSTKSSYPNIIHKYLMQTETATLNLGHLTTGDDNWILLNHDFVNFHRTHYSNEMLSSISADLSILNAIDRLSFLSDSFALAQAGSTSIEIFLNILSLYKHETNGYVWKTILNIITTLYALIMHTEKINEFRMFVIGVCKPMAKSVGWHPIGSINDDDVNTLMCREAVQNIMALMLDDDTIYESEKLFQLKCTGAAQLPSGLKKAVYTAVLSNDRVLEEIFRFYETSENPEERCLILKALSSVRPIGLFDKVLDWSLAKASYEDAVILLGDMAKNLGSCDRSSCVWKFIKTNWKVIFERYSDGILIGRLLKPIIECLITKDDENDVKAYFQVNQIHGAEKSIACGLERLSIQQCFLRRLKIQIDNYTF